MAKKKEFSQQKKAFFARHKKYPRSFIEHMWKHASGREWRAAWDACVIAINPPAAKAEKQG